MIVLNSLSGLAYFAAGPSIARNAGGLPTWTMPVLGLLCLANVVFAGALFAWKKWGFFGFAIGSILATGFNIAVGLGLLQSLSGLIGVGILWGVLQLGEPRSGWEQLE